MPAPRIRPLASLLLGLVMTAGCSAAIDPGATDAATTAIAAATGETTASATTTTLADTHDDEDDYLWDASDEVAVALSDAGSSGGAGVSIDGSTVTITSAGTYRLSGSLSDGQVVVDSGAEGIVRLVLDGASITSSTTSPLSVVDADKVVVILAEGTQSTLADAAAYQYASADVDEPNAALFSTADLTIAGEGSLTVTGRSNDAIASKDGLIIASGAITVDAVDDGIRGKDYLVVKGGTLLVDAGGDALKADNEEDAALGYVTIADGTLDLTAGTDAIDAVSSVVIDGGSLAIAAGDDAIHSDVRLEVNGGTIDITRSYEGLEATQIVISGGVINLVAEDDGLNVAGGVDGSGWQQEGVFGGRGGGGGGMEAPAEGYYAEIGGGTLVMATGGDGLDSNGSLTVTGGTIVVNGPTSNGNGAIDVNGELLISGGTLLAAGSSGMAETPSAASAQASLALDFGSVQPAGTIVRIQAADGTGIATFEASKAFQSLAFSSPGVATATDYEVLVGGSVDGDSLGGLYLDPDYSPGTSIGTVSAGTR